MPIEIKELIIQALVGKRDRKDGSHTAEKKKKQAQVDVVDIVAKMIKNEKER